MTHARSTTRKTTATTYKGVATGRLVRLQSGVSLPKGTNVTVLVEKSSKGSPAAVLEALRHLPRLKPRDVDELDRVIEEGKQPVRAEGIFDRPRSRRR